MALLHRIVNALVYFEPAKCCQIPADFVLAPLPGAKQFWEAANESAWIQRRGSLCVDESYGLTTGGDIVRLDGRQLSYADTWVSMHPSDSPEISRITGGWVEWCAGMDSLGGLVMLAASLCGHSP